MFGYTILGWGIMDSKSVKCPFHVLMLNYFFRKEFSPSIGVRYFDFIARLRLNKCLILFVGPKSITLLRLEVEFVLAGMVIRASGDI